MLAKMITLSSIPVSFDKTTKDPTKISKQHVNLNTPSKHFVKFYPKTFTGFSGDDDNSSDAGLTKEERKEKYR